SRRRTVPSSFFFLLLPRSPISTLFPYTTLFRSEVARSIENAIAKRYQHSYWIKAEMNKLNFYQHSGHCYPDLVEKRDGKVVAQRDRKSTRLNSSHVKISYAVFCLKKKRNIGHLC